MSGQQQIPYLEERKLIKRWSGPWPMLANMAFTLLIFAVTWWVFQDPRGIMRFYTPYVGYNYCRWWLIILIWMAYIFDFWPFRRDWVRSAHPLQKGLVLALVSVGIMIAMIHGFFEGVLGNLAFAYFNPAQLQKLGLTDFYSTEYAAQACMMFAVIASWISPAWLVALEGQPWAGLSQPVRGFSIWLGTFCLSLLIYFMTMHNHMGILYYPWQYFTAICPPYWEHFAETVSANFHVAWIMCCTVVVWFMEGIWERFPFTMIKTPWLRRLALFFGIIAISWALCMFFWYMQELVWGDAIRGHRRDAAPDWRWLHVGETAIFFLVPALFLQFYCGNWPNRFSTPINVLVRSLLVTLGGIAIYCLYYKYAHFVLGTQKGFSHPQQFPMIPMIWLINIWLINWWFMDGWPGWRREFKTAEDFAAEERHLAANAAWNPAMLPGVIIGLVVGVIAYFAIVALLPLAVAGLDVVARERFYQLLLEDFAQTGRTFLVSTHIIEEAASVFEQVIILDQGRILENSPTEELVEQFRYISGREDVVDQACAGLEVLSVQQMGRHKTAAVRGSDAQFRQARQADVDVSPMNLQNVFVALCGHGDAQ